MHTILFLETTAVLNIHMNTLISLLHEDGPFNQVEFHETACHAYTELEALRKHAAAMPDGNRKERAYEAISLFSQGLHRQMVRSNQRAAETLTSVAESLPMLPSRPAELTVDDDVAVPELSLFQGFNLTHVPQAATVH